MFVYGFAFTPQTRPCGTIFIGFGPFPFRITAFPFPPVTTLVGIIAHAHAVDLTVFEIAYVFGARGENIGTSPVFTIPGDALGVQVLNEEKKKYR